MLQDEGYQLMGAAFAVYNYLGHGMAEEVYQECLEAELEIRGIPYRSKRKLEMAYKGRRLRCHYVPDLFVCDGIVVELKAVENLCKEHEAQIFNYMRISGQRVGYLINFGKKGNLEWKRFILSDLKDWNEENSKRGTPNRGEL